MERSHERVRPSEVSGYRTPQPCVCQPLHGGCDPDLCEKAIGIPLKSWIEDNEPVETIFLYNRAEEWAEGADRGCITCAAVAKLAGIYVRPGERVAIQRKAEECTIFGQRIYKDGNDRESRFIKIPTRS
jgi:hypothetical protein